MKRAAAVIATVTRKGRVGDDRRFFVYYNMN